MALIYTDNDSHPLSDCGYADGLRSSSDDEAPLSLARCRKELETRPARIDKTRKCGVFGSRAKPGVSKGITTPGALKYRVGNAESPVKRYNKHTTSKIETIKRTLRRRSKKTDMLPYGNDRAGGYHAGGPYPGTANFANFTKRVGGTQCRLCSVHPTHTLLPCGHTVCYDHFLADDHKFPMVCAFCFQVQLNIHLLVRLPSNFSVAC